MPVVEGIDLDEIRIRESERVEWKLRAADPKDVVRSVVAIANDLHNLGGGYIVCGAEEAENAHGFQRLVAQGLTAQEIKRIQDKAVGALRSQVSPPLAVRTVEIPVSDPERRILVIVVAQSPQAHQFEKEYWIRSGRQTQSARNGVLLELNRQKRAGASVDLRPVPGATVDDLDLLAVRDWLTRAGLWDGEIAGWLSPGRPAGPMAPSMMVEDAGVVRPRLATMLCFGRMDSPTFQHPGTVMARFDGLERSANVAERTQFGGTLLFQCADVLRALQTELYVRIDKRLPLPNSTRYPTSAIQEALVNAYIHGDPRTNTPIHVDVFPDRIEITSIGAPPSGVTLDQATNIPLSNLRYRGLACFFLGVRLAQTLGTGVKRMREALLGRDPHKPEPTRPDPLPVPLPTPLPASPLEASAIILELLRQGLRASPRRDRTAPYRTDALRPRQG